MSVTADYPLTVTVLVQRGGAPHIRRLLVPYSRSSWSAACPRLLQPFLHQRRVICDETASAWTTISLLLSIARATTGDA